MKCVAYLLVLLLYMPLLTAQDIVSITVPGALEYELFLAVDKKDVDEVKTLLEQGADVNANTLEGLSLLHFAVYQEAEKIVPLLIKKGARVNSTDDMGQTPLHYAVKASKRGMAGMLVDSGAFINIRDMYGRTALLQAVEMNNDYMAEWLLENKANPDVADNDSIYPLHIAVDNGYLPTFNLLLQHRANVNVKDGKGNTPLHVAALYGDTLLTDRLLLKGAKLEATNNNGLTPLALGVLNEHVSYVEFIDNYYHSDLFKRFGYSRNYLTLSKQTGNEVLIDFFQSKGVPKNPYPYFYRWSIGVDQMIQSNDYMLDIHLGLVELKYNAGLYTGILFRPSFRKTLFKESNNIQYQYAERIVANYIGVYKNYALWGLQKRGAGFYTSVEGHFIYGRFRGTDAQPLKRIKPSFQGGVFYNNQWFEIKLGYKYLDFNRTNIKKGFVNLNTTFRIGL